MVISDRSVAALAKEDAKHLLHEMVLIRRFEEKAAEMYGKGKIHGFLHLYIGQEAVAEGRFRSCARTTTSHPLQGARPRDDAGRGRRTP